MQSTPSILSALRLSFGLALLTATTIAGTAPAPLHFVALEPTVLFPKREPLAQVARLVVRNDSDQPIAADVEISVAGGAASPPQRLSLAPHQQGYDVLVPDIAAPAEVRVAIRVEGRAPILHTQVWKPQRKWKVFIVKSSHEDIGYENFIFKKQHEIANFIDLGHELSSPKSVLGGIEATADVLYNRKPRPGDSQPKPVGSVPPPARSSAYHYTLESILFQRNYIEERGERAWRRLVEQDLKPGHMSMMGAPSGVHSHWMDYEQLARMTYPARRETKDRFGLDIRTFMIVDNPSLSWSGVQVLADSGFKYVARWGQPWRTGSRNDYATTKLPPIFWWIGPDGTSRVLFTWRSHYAMGFWWGQTGTYRALVDLATTQVSKHLQEVENGALGEYPYDALITPEYVDHDTPRFDNRVLPLWRERYAYPEISVASPDTFFSYIESRYGDSLPQLRGDLNNYSADYSSIDPESQGWKREASRLLPAAESLAVLAGAQTPQTLLNPSLIERTYTRMFDFDEHCWPTLPKVTDAQLFNANWVKRHEGRRILDITQGLFGQASMAMARQISTGEGEHIAVFNALAHVRSDLVRSPDRLESVIDLQTGVRIPAEILPAGGSAFVAKDVPALGYKLYRVNRASTPASPRQAGAPPSVLAADAASLTSPHYRIRFDPATGAIRSILDRELDRELVDQSSPYQANQLVYVRAADRESKEVTETLIAKPTRHATQVGEVQASYSVWIDDPHTGAKIRQTVTVYAERKRIDVVNELEHAKVLSVDHQERYRNNLFYAFPWKVDGGQFRVEYPGGVVRPYLDQLRWGSHDYLHANRWVDISNRDFGITVAPWNAANFHFGEIRYNQLSNDYQPKGSWLFSYAWSDRMAGLITLNAEDCRASFGYSITSHRGDWNAGDTTAFGWAVATPLAAIPLPSGQKGAWTKPAQGFLSLDAKNVQLTVLKAGAQPSGGWIARLVETEGQATQVTADVSALGIDSARLCSIVEDDLAPITVRDGKLSVPIRPFGIVTLRLLAGPTPTAAAGLSTAVLSDSEVQLAARGRPEAVYNIYRSDDPDAPPTDYTLVGRMTGSRFTDRGLNPRTTYNYQIAEVSPGNRQGPMSEVQAVTTSAMNHTPPRPVEELGGIRRSPTSAFIYWRRSDEPDLAVHRVYRSETPAFEIGAAAPLVSLQPNPNHFLQVYLDDRMTPGKTYYYRVVSEDWAGNRQSLSPEISITSPQP
jgi:alpha-mannosidase